MTDRYVIKETPDDPRDTDAADAAVDRVRECNGDEVLVLSDRIGAKPYLRFTPYRNHRGVRVHMWSCISITGKVMPDRTLLFHPRIVDPARLDDYPLRMFTTEWVRQEARRSRLVEVEPLDETPFGGEMMWWGDDDD